MTTLQEAARKALYALEASIDGDHPYYDDQLTAIEALRTALAQQGEQQVCAGCGIPVGDVHMSTCQSGKWPSRVSNGDTAAPAPQAQPMTDPCKTCSHFKEGNLPGVRIHDETCYGCSEYYANKWEAKSE